MTTYQTYSACKENQPAAAAPFYIRSLSGRFAVCFRTRPINPSPLTLPPLNESLVSVTLES
jgi:hypothetical protein